MTGIGSREKATRSPPRRQTLCRRTQGANLIHSKVKMRECECNSSEFVIASACVPACVCSWALRFVITCSPRSDKLTLRTAACKFERGRPSRCLVYVRITLKAFHFIYLWTHAAVCCWRAVPDRKTMRTSCAVSL